jgi:hypothetical protein
LAGRQTPAGFFLLISRFLKCRISAASVQSTVVRLVVSLVGAARRKSAPGGRYFYALHIPASDALVAKASFLA